MAKYEIMKQFLLNALGHIRPAREETRRADKPPFKRLSLNISVTSLRYPAKPQPQNPPQNWISFVAKLGWLPTPVRRAGGDFLSPCFHQSEAFPTEAYSWYVLIMVDAFAPPLSLSMRRYYGCAAPYFSHATGVANIRIQCQLREFSGIF
jgi:hypothetical protein